MFASRIFTPTLIMRACVLFLLAINVSPSYSGNAYLDEGIRRYQAADYQHAKESFAEAQSAEFNNPVLHYYYGNTLLKMGLKNDAIKQYEMALTLKHDGQVGEYCREALLRLNAKQLFQSPTPSSMNTASALPPKPVEDKFADEERNIRAEAAAQVKAAQETMNNEVKTIQDQATQDITNVQTQASQDTITAQAQSGVYGIPLAARTFFDPYGVQLRTDDIKREAKARTQRITDEFEKRKQGILDAAQARIDALHSTRGGGL